MAANSTEIEIKYEAAAGVTLPSFDELPQVARTKEADEEHLDAEYFDTDDLRLLRVGVTLRRREGGHDAGWHLKLPAGDYSRREISLPLSAGRRRIPEELARLVRVHARGQELKPVAKISTARRRQLLLNSAGEQLAEVARDDVTARGRGERSTVSKWHEIEVELTGGGSDLLEAADRLLRRDGFSRATKSTKLARALDLPEPASDERRAAGPAAPAGDILTGYLAAQLSALKALDPMVRSNEPDALHQMRIATRRIRSTLQSFQRFFDKAETGSLVDESRWLGAVLGEARDAEVLGAHLQGQVASLPAEQVVGPVAARIREHFARLGVDAQAVAVNTLDSPRYFALLDRLDELIATAPETKAARRPGIEVLPGAVRRTYKTTSRRMKRALCEPEGKRGDVALHQARKAAKRARYAGEAVAPAFGTKAGRFASNMKRLQTVLGAHQDAVIARQADRELGMSAHLAGQNAFTYGVLYELDDQEARQLRGRARQTWRSASRPRLRRWLR